MAEQKKGNSKRFKNDKSKENKNRKSNDNPLKPDIPAYLSDEDVVSTAEKVVLHLNGKNALERFENHDKTVLKKGIESGTQCFSLTTTKIRNLLSILNVIYQMVQKEAGKEISNKETIGKIQYFKVRCAYEAGRDDAVKDFVEKSNIMNYVDKIGTSKQNFVIFFHYVESLVAYHRYYGGKN